jgi:hypothetical protein
MKIKEWGKKGKKKEMKMKWYVKGKNEVECVK